jgi:hypothetical protein
MYFMEHRRDPRVPTEQPVSLTVLSDPEIRMLSTVKDASGRGLGLLCPQSVPSGAALKIEFGDTLFLGEAMYCETSETGYLVGVELTQVLSGLAALSRMAETFKSEFEPAASRRR